MHNIRYQPYYECECKYYGSRFFSFGIGGSVIRSAEKGCQEGDGTWKLGHSEQICWERVWGGSWYAKTGSQLSDLLRKGARREMVRENWVTVIRSVEKECQEGDGTQKLGHSDQICWERVPGGRWYAKIGSQWSDLLGKGARREMVCENWVTVIRSAEKGCQEGDGTWKLGHSDHICWERVPGGRWYVKIGSQIEKINLCFL